MQSIFLFFLILTSIYADDYVFLMQKSSVEVELEAKIITKIAKDTFNDQGVVLFIPNQNQNTLDVYSKFVNITTSCENANFIFIKDSKFVPKDECLKKSKIIFTNSYKRLLSGEGFTGAFFWSKARPNIVFSKSKLNENGIKLPNSYTQFIEEL